MRSHILTRLDLDPAQLAPDLDYLSNVPRIEEQYDEFSSGYWKNVSLANASGKADDTTYRDISGAAIDTGHGEHTPYLMSLVEEHFVRDRYQFPAEQTYDVLREICSRSSDEALATKAEELTGFMIGARTMDERFTMTEWAA